MVIYMSKCYKEYGAGEPDKNSLVCKKITVPPYYNYSIFLIIL